MTNKEAAECLTYILNKRLETREKSKSNLPLEDLEALALAIDVLNKEDDVNGNRN